MLKFRRTKSFKSKRFSEMQRKSLDDKVPMEWAWMPLAAVMNKNTTDLVYWVPPIYTANKITRGSCKSLRASKSKCSIRRTPSRRPTIRKTSNEQQNSPSKKRKLCQRRAKLHATSSVLGEMEPDAELSKTSLIRQEALESHSVDLEENKSESEKSADESLIPFPEVRQVNSSCNQKNAGRKTPTNDKIKLEHASSLLKLLEKLSCLYKRRSMKKSNSRSKSKNKKRKRPSVKLYRAPSERVISKRESVYRKGTLLPSIKSRRLDRSKNVDISIDKSSDVPDVNHTEKSSGVFPSEDKQITKFQLALTVLANYFEKKFEAQNNEIELMKMKLQRQEKVLKHTAQLSLQMKNHIATVNARLDNIEHIGAKIYKQEEYFMPYVTLDSLNEGNTSDSCAESCDESTSVSQSSLRKKSRSLHNPKLVLSHSKDQDYCNFRETYRTSVKLQINGNSISD